MTDMIKVTELRAHTFATHTHADTDADQKKSLPQFHNDAAMMIMPLNQTQFRSSLCAHAANE